MFTVMYTSLGSGDILVRMCGSWEKIMVDQRRSRRFFKQVNHSVLLIDLSHDLHACGNFLIHIDMFSGMYTSLGRGDIRVLMCGSWKKIVDDRPYCHGIDQTPLHLFVECPIAKSFWNKFTMWYNATCRGNITLEQNEIIYGVLKYTLSGLTLNHLIIIGKYFLYINAVQDEKRPQFTDFVTLVNEKIELEKYIAITTNKLLSFTKKWSNFLNN